MKVVTSPFTWATGQPLPPEELNLLYEYARDAVDDVGRKRWAKAPLLFPFRSGLGTPYTEASGELLTYRFTCPFTCVVERCYLDGNFTCAAELKVSITKASDASTPTGASAPLLSTLGATTGNDTGGYAESATGIIATATDDTRDVNQDRFVLAAGVEYKLTVSSSAAFSLQRFDVILHLAVDRWTLGATTTMPRFAPTLFTDASARDATVVAANNTALATEAARFANARTACFPMLFVKHGFLSGTDADLLKRTIPLFDPARASCRILRSYVYAVMASAGGTGAVTATIQNAAGAAQVTASATITGVAYASGDSGAVNKSLEGAAGDTVDTTKDWRLDFANADAAVSCSRAHALVWVARAAT